MKRLSVSVYRDRGLGDCTNHGVSSRHDRMTLFWECSRKEALDYAAEHGMEVDACLWLNVRYLWEEDHSKAEPLVLPTDKCGPMWGGNFIYTSDSRLYKQNGQMCGYPIPIHDRFEPEKENRALSI